MNDYIKNYHKTMTQEEHNFYDIVKGKRVMIVGPSPYLNNKKLGKYIDSFDLIVRVNQCIFAAESHPDDYGSRTDILYQSQRARDRYLDNFPKEFEKTKRIILLTQIKQDDFPKMEFLCFQCGEKIKHGEEYCLNSDWDQDGVEPKIGHPLCVYPTLDYSTYKVPVIKRDISIYQKSLGISILTGLLSVVEMMMFQALEVHVLGFDFYHGIKKAMKSNETSAGLGSIYCNGYLVFNGTLGLSHKDEDAQQLYMFKQIYEEFKNFPYPRLYIDRNLKNILDETFNNNSFFRYTKYEEDFKNYIRDKRVVIVGPGPWLNGKEMGSYIDKFDVVIRFNLGYNLTNSNPKDFGSRTDIVYINEKYQNHFNFKYPQEMKSMKYLVLNTNVFNENKNIECVKCKKQIEKGHEFVNIENQKLHKLCYRYVDYDLLQTSKIVTCDMYPLSKKLEGSHTLSGLVAIDHIKSMSPKSIHVMGFDFYNALKEAAKNKTNTIRYADIYTHGYQLIGGINPQQKDMQGKNIAYFHNLYKKSKNITVDDNLQTILK